MNKEPKIHTPGTKVCKNFGFWEEIQNLILNKSNAALTLIILTVFKKIKVLKKFWIFISIKNLIIFSRVQATLNALSMSWRVSYKLKYGILKTMKDNHFYWKIHHFLLMWMGAEAMLEKVCSQLGYNSMRAFMIF